jgi:hypothetical protein
MPTSAKRARSYTPTAEPRSLAAHAAKTAAKTHAGATEYDAMHVKNQTTKEW